MTKSSYEEAIKGYVENLSTNPQVLAVVLTGSAGRDSRDKYSDIDNVVVLNSKDRYSIREGKFELNNFLFDTRIVFLEDLLAKKWSSDMYFAYLNSRIVYDPNCNFHAFLLQKKSEWEQSVIKLISLTLVNLSVYIHITDNWKKLSTETHFNKFIKRKDFISAHRVLTHSLDMLIDLIFLCNKRPIPDYKNKIKLLGELEWVPEKYTERISGIMLINKLTLQDVEKRYQLVEDLFLELKNFLSIHFTLPDDLYTYYLNHRD